MKTQGEVKELLQSLSLEAGEEKEFSITIKEEDLRFILADGTWGTEAGLYRILSFRNAGSVCIWRWTESRRCPMWPIKWKNLALKSVRYRWGECEKAFRRWRSA